MLKQFDHMIEPKLTLELSNVCPRLKFLAGCGQFSDFSNKISANPSLVAEQKACMMLNINLDCDWIMGEGANYKTSIILNGRKQICHSHLGRRFLFSRPSAKRLLRRLHSNKSILFVSAKQIYMLS